MGPFFMSGYCYWALTNLKQCSLKPSASFSIGQQTWAKLALWAKTGHLDVCLSSFWL